MPPPDAAGGGGVVMGTRRDGTDLRTLEAGDEIHALLTKREI